MKNSCEALLPYVISPGRRHAALEFVDVDHGLAARRSRIAASSSPAHGDPPRHRSIGPSIGRRRRQAVGDHDVRSLVLTTHKLFQRGVWRESSYSKKSTSVPKSFDANRWWNLPFVPPELVLLFLDHVGKSDGGRSSSS